MKIILDGRAIVNQYDGISRYSINVIHAISEVAPNISISVLTRSDLSENTKNDLPGKIHYVPVPFGHLNTKTLLNLGARVDFMHGSIYHSLFCIQPLIMNTTGIITVHDTMWFQRPLLQAEGKWLRALLGWSYHRLAGWLSAKKAKAIVTVSETTGSDIISIWPEFEDKIYVIGEGVEKKFTHISDKLKHEQLINSFGLSSTQYFLVIGSGKPYKNVTNVLKAFARLNSNSPFRLVMTGKTSAYTSSNLNLAKELGLGEKFIFLGSVSDDELVALLQGAQALVFPSLYEGFGLPAVEAMACGCPVITSKRGALEEVAGDAAMYVDPLDIDQISNAMKTLANSPETVLNIRGKGIVRASLFDWKRTGEEIVKMYGKLI